MPLETILFVAGLKVKKAFLSTLALLVVGLLLVGCDQKAVPQEPVWVTDAVGREVTLSALPTRIFAKLVRVLFGKQT